MGPFSSRHGRLLLPRFSSLAAMLAASALNVGVGQAAAQTQVLQACVGKSAGLLRLVEPGAGCRAGETPVSWNVQGPPGPAGPQTMLSAYVYADGTTVGSSVPAGATLTTSRTGQGAYLVQITGLGNQCPLFTATAYGNQYMYLGNGSCGEGNVEFAVYTSTGQDAIFNLVAVGVGPANQAARKPAGTAIPPGQP